MKQRLPDRRSRVPSAVQWLAVGVLSGACATTIPPGAGSNPADPFERMNRRVDAFNQAFDRGIARPVARSYNELLPKVVRDCLSNFFDNIGEVGNFINASLQGEASDAAKDVGRLVINSTVGVAGCFDVAGPIGLERHRRNFGLTMGRWGMTPGPYLVLPFLGPSTVRQTVGLGPDYFLTDPVAYITPWWEPYAIDSVRLLGERAALLDASKLVEQAALDPYAFVRDAYLQNLRNRVYDGNPPPPPVEEDPDDAPEAGAPPPASRPAP